LRIRAFIDHQPGNLIPVDKVGNISVRGDVQTRLKEFEETQSKLVKVLKHLFQRAAVFFRRERTFRQEVEAERSARFKRSHKSKVLIQKEDFLRTNRETLDNLREKCRELWKRISFEQYQSADSQISALFKNVSVSYSQYRAFVEARTETAIYAKETALQVRVFIWEGKSCAFRAVWSVPIHCNNIPTPQIITTLRHHHVNDV
jgi:hemerythrin